VIVRAYYRVSTGDQTLDQQQAIVRDYCSGRGWQIAKEYEETESTRKERPRRDGLLKEMRSGEAIVTVRMDRIGRSTRELLDLAHTCHERGVSLVFIKEQIDFTTDAGRLYFRLLASINEFERDLISSRTKEKLAIVRLKLRAEGRDLGRPPLSVPADKLRAMKEQGASLNYMADALGVSVNTVKKWTRSLDGDKDQKVS
jgi:DNA invertase Pin-like site-specific DNA recombinase